MSTALSTGDREKVAVLGLAFKCDTDDARDSLARKLIPGTPSAPQVFAFASERAALAL